MNARRAIDDEPRDRIAVAFDGWTEEWDHWLDHRFPATERTIRVDQSAGGWYCATINSALRFPPTPNLETVIRFVRAFAVKEGVRVDEGSVELARGSFEDFSVRVPDNVIALPVRAVEV